jgi:hypothetical protein
LGSCRNLKFYNKLIAYQSTTTTNIPPATNENKKQEIRPQYPLLDTKFDQYQIAYRYRHSLELLRGYFVYRLFSISFLVNNQDKVKFPNKKKLIEIKFN